MMRLRTQPLPGTLQFGLQIHTERRFLGVTPDGDLLLAENQNSPRVTTSFAWKWEDLEIQDNHVYIGSHVQEGVNVHLFYLDKETTLLGRVESLERMMKAVLR